MVRNSSKVCLLVGLLLSYPALANLKFLSLTTDDGLSSNSVLGIARDKKGFMWIGTSDGLNRFDGYDFKVFKHDPENPNSLSDNFILTLLVDRQGHLWIGTLGGGVSRFDPETETFFNYPHSDEKEGNQTGNSIQAFVQDSLGNIWASSTENGLSKINPATNEIEQFRYDPNNPASLSSDTIRSLIEDENKNLWVATSNGLDRINIETRQVRRAESSYVNQVKRGTWLLNLGEQGEIIATTLDSRFLFIDSQGQLIKTVSYSIGDQAIRSMVYDKIGTLWFGTKSSGLYRVKIASNKIDNFQNTRHNRFQLNSNNIFSLYQVESEQLWIGSANGVNILGSSLNNFATYDFFELENLSVRDEDITVLFENENKDLWMGAYKGLYKRNHQGKPSRYLMNEQEPDSVSNSIYNISQNRAGEILVGTGNGLYRYNKESDQFFRLPVSDRVPWNNWNSAAVDANDNFWFGIGSNKGLVEYNPKNQKMTRYFHESINQNKPSNMTILSLLADQDFIWVGASGNLIKMNIVDKSFSQYTITLPGSEKILTTQISKIIKDHVGNIWLGTLDGLVKFNPKTEAFVIYDDNDGLVNNSIFQLIEDEESFIWIGTDHGISRFNPEKKSFKNFTKADGIDNDSFNWFQAWVKTHNGDLLFGSRSGISRYSHKEFVEDIVPPRLVFTDLLHHNQPVVIENLIGEIDNKTLDSVLSISENRDFKLEKNIAALDEITLTDNDDFISFKFSALNYLHPKKIQYAFKLSGVNKDWIYTDAENRLATYSDIPSGEHIFQVKATNAQGVWSDKVLSLKVIKLPPWWLSFWAYNAYALVLILTIAAFVRAHQKKILYERNINKRLLEADRLKDEFLANTSHELKTPLNGIVGLVESLISGVRGNLSREVKSDLKMAASSGKRLSHLVNDILDFSRLRNHSLDLYLQSVDLYSLVEAVLSMSKSLLGDKPVSLINNIDKTFSAVIADEKRLQQILYNLVGNAIKFTESGDVRVSAELIDEKVVEVRVKDSGIGISEKQLQSIFESFRQADGSIGRVYGGTGLGLSLTKKLVELQGGQMRVESKVEHGSVFYFTILAVDRSAHTRPVYKVKIPDIDEDRALSDDDKEHAKPVIDGKENGCWRILIVDDDAINRQVVVNHLHDQKYLLKPVSGGKEALKLLEQEAFDLVLLDVMMPVMSGFEVCQQIRKTHSIEALPIIFLTAKNQEADLMKEFGLGANDYLAKPIARHELLSRIKLHLNLLDINRNLNNKVKERTEEIIRTAEIGKKITSGLDLDSSLQAVYQQLKSIMPVELFGVGIYQTKNNRIYYQFSASGDKRHEPYYRIMDNKQQFSVWCIEHGQPLLINDVATQGQLYLKEMSCQEVEKSCYVIEQGVRCKIPASQIYVPIKSSNRILGVMSVHSYTKSQYQSVHLDLLSSIAAYVAIVMENADIYERLKASYENIV